MRTYSIQKLRPLKPMRLIALLLITITTQSLWAQDKALNAEAEAGVIINKGNTESQSLTFKTMNKYSLSEKTNLSLRGEYFRTTGDFAGTTEVTSQNSLAEIKAEQLLSENLGVFAIGSWSNDIFRGFETRLEAGLGLSYHFLKSDTTTLFTEQGYSFRNETAYEVGPGNGPTSETHFWRAYFEATQKISDTLSGKIWAESKMNLRQVDDLEVRVEPSFDVILSGNMSLGLAYRISFDNVPPEAVPAKKKIDQLYTTTLKIKL